MHWLIWRLTKVLYVQRCLHQLEGPDCRRRLQLNSSYLAQWAEHIWKNFFWIVQPSRHVIKSHSCNIILGHEVVCSFHIDDIIIYSQNADKNILPCYNYTVALTQSRIHVESWEGQLLYWEDGLPGHVVEQHRLELGNNTNNTVLELESPGSVTRWRPFLGLWNVCHHFVPNVFGIDELLNETLKKAQARTSFTSRRKIKTH